MGETDSIPVSLVSPNNGAVNQLPVLIVRWNANSYGQPYHIEVASDSTFTGGMLFNDSTITDTVAAINILSNNSTYYWRVQSSRSIHQNIWSEVRHWTNQVVPPSMPALAVPANGAVNQPILLTLRWHPVQAAARYQVQVSVDSLFSILPMNDSTITDTFRLTITLFNSTRYYWHVRGVNVGGSGSYSSMGSFTTVIDTPAIPQLIAPADDGINLPTTLTLNWNHVALADSYRLEVSTDSTFVNSILVSTDTTTAHQVGPLQNFTTYFWRVSASNIGGASPFSSVRKFTTIIAAPNPIVPPNGSTQPSHITLRWLHLQEAMVYDVQVASDSLMTMIFRVDSNLVDTTVSIDSLQAHAAYYWQVRAKNMVSDGEWSQPWKFIVELTGATVTISSGWNLLSLPLQTSEIGKDSLFPTSSSNAFSYNPDTGYVQQDSLTILKGYWLRFSTMQIISFLGNPIEADTIDVKKGWNLIGSETMPISVNAVASTPPGIITSRFFGYVEAYIAVDTIKPGKGYWVKVTQDGTIVFSTIAPSHSVKTISAVSSSELPPPPPFEENARTNGRPMEFFLQDNFPNPFNPSTHINYALPAPSYVRLIVFDLLGRVVADLINQFQDAGYKSVSFDASNLPSGVYVYRLQAGKFSSVKKMVLMK